MITGQSVGKIFSVVPYGVNDDGVIDYDKVLEIAKECKPKMIIAGAALMQERSISNVSVKSQMKSARISW